MKGQPRLEIRLPAEAKQRIESVLFSTLEQRIPLGRISEWCAEACTFRVDAVELQLPEGRLWCDRAVYETLKMHLPAMGIKPLTDTSDGF